MVFGVIYSGMLYYEYSTLSSVARSVARERAISPRTEIEDEKIIVKYFKDGRFQYGQITSLYNPDTNPISLEIIDDDVVVKINMKLGERSPLMELVLPERYSIIYHMKKDYRDTTSSTP